MKLLFRREAIDTFQSKGPQTPSVFLLSLKAGGVGLNLTAANHLLLINPAWNPATGMFVFLINYDTLDEINSLLIITYYPLLMA